VETVTRVRRGPSSAPPTVCRRNPHNESAASAPHFCLSSSHDESDRRPDGKVPGQNAWSVHDAAVRRRDCLNPAQARQRLPGRLAVVFPRSVISGFFLDQHRRQAAGLFRRFDGDRRHPLADGLLAVRLPGGSDTSRRLRVETMGNAPPPDLFTLIRGRLPWPGLSQAVQVCSLCWRRSRSRNWAPSAVSLSGPYGADDPLYNKDIGFYLSHCPPISSSRTGCCLHSSERLFAGTIYWVHGRHRIRYHHRQCRRQRLLRLGVCSPSLGGEAWSYGLDRYLLLYGDNGVVVGASYTDIMWGYRPLWLLIGLSIIAAIRRVANLRCAPYCFCRRVHTRRHRLFRAVRCSLWLFRSFSSNQASWNWKKPYIERKLRSHGRHTSRSDRQPGRCPRTEAYLQHAEANKATSKISGLWTGLPLSDTYAQLQEIRT